ncbi:hypothetical protein SAMN04488066_10755 [Halorubrum aquaticum]|uniref:DUF7310 domain-containing protein n=1 Tax=Halorubrum aquaticum TaxID=387340 RepID=A0A1I3AS39_9EURY|nr:hypothetical protein [Halorubrum aquaticum]SFH52832.1 hypothetical protein SAMN04488066_10755 [Halorubrum aquaticum]
MASETNAAGSPPDRARLEERLDAVERALTGTDRSVAGVADGVTADAEREALAERLDAIETRIEELEAATQAVRGYAGAIRAVNREVERRADLALARATAARDGSASTLEAPNDGGTLDDDAPEPDEIPGDDALDAAIPDDPSTDGRSLAANVGRFGSGSESATERRSGDRATGSGPNDGSEGKASPLERLREAL